MNTLPVESVEAIEEEIVSKLLDKHETKLDCLFFDTTNFFTFIDSANEHCNLPQRGRNKQKRFDLRQIGLALLVSKDEQFPLFYKTYRGNKNDVTTFKENCRKLIDRLRKVTRELADVTLVFDKGNNSKDNFAQLNQEEGCYYVAGLVSSYFKDLIRAANKNFSDITIEGETLPAYRIKTQIWGYERTCVITVSEQLLEGQIRGIEQHLEKKYKSLNVFKQQLENPNARKKFNREEIEERLQNIIRGQFIEEILKYDFISLENGRFSFTYFIDSDAFTTLKKEVLGRQIAVTNRHDWSNEEILLAYRGQSKVEYAFRTIKNPYHMAIRPQYHWTDQKIEAHFLMCIIGYLLSVYTYEKVKRFYKRNIGNMLNDLSTIRLACIAKNGKKISYQLEKVPRHLQRLTKTLGISNENIRPKLNFSGYT